VRLVDRRNLILRGYKDTGTPTFWTEGYRTPTFRDKKVKNLLSPANKSRACERSESGSGKWSGAGQKIG